MHFEHMLASILEHLMITKKKRGGQLGYNCDVSKNMFDYRIEKRSAAYAKRLDPPPPKGCRACSDLFCSVSDEFFSF